MLDVILLGIIKVIDNVVTTAKSITVYQNKKILTSILVIISQFMFYFVVKSVVDDSTLLSTCIVCICSGIGTYIAMFINERCQKDVTYTNILTCSCTDSIDAMCECLLSHNIKYIPVDSYNRENEHTKTILAFAQTKYESKIIDEFLENSETKYLRQILR
jgi:hypothetical protein